MLQMQKSVILTRRRKRRRCTEVFYYSSILYSTLLIIGCLTYLPKGSTQHNDDLYIVKPTPVVQFGKEELTTVLLVNNENHGRFINVRPEVGLLTSTARTFIQEGVTTEYATQVVGTTLDNGRVYAQYLKKSSRVLYDKNGVPLPSVVTSWVGESVHGDATFLPQSHNDLFNADQSDWQDIDDRLLGDRHQFIGNTDYVESLKRKTGYSTSSKGNEEDDKLLQRTIGISSLSSFYPSNGKSIPNSAVPQFTVLDKDTRNFAANKVLPIGDLPTYTIKLNYEPRVQFKSNDYDDENDETLDDNRSVEGFDRSLKLIYKKLMQNNLQEMSLTSPALKPLIPASRHFATVTYYGFADFTTVVGDSVIVFSPTTSAPNINLKAHVTSIKGEATLGAELPNISTVPIAIVEDLIEPTLSVRSSIEPSLTMITATSVVSEISKNTQTEHITTEIPAATKVDSKHPQEMEFMTTVLETSEVLTQSLQSEAPLSNKQMTTTLESVLLSRPSDEEILRIYNSLANAYSKTEDNNIKLIETTSTSTLSTSAANIIETSSVQIFGGATTIFFEDDPFANFLDATKSTTSLKSSKPKLNDINLDKTSTLTNEDMPKQELSSENESSTIISTEEFSTESDITTSEATFMDTTSSSTSTTPTSNDLDSIENSLQIHAENTPTTLLSNVLIKEIDPNKDEIPSNCISTSQVFLTQLPKTITNYETITRTNNLSEATTETKLQIQPTFEIKEATKYYCIQATSTQPNQIESPLVNTKISEDSSEKPPKELDNSEVQTDKEEKALEVEEEKSEEEEDDNEENTTENLEDITTQQSFTTIENKDHFESKGAIEENNKHEVYKTNEEDEEETSDHPEEDDVSGDDDDEEIELIYKTLYTTYTYLTTFFHDDSTSVSSHTEVVTNVITSTLGLTTLASASLENHSGTQLLANLNENEINPTNTIKSVMSSTLETTSKRYMVPSEVESLIRTEEQHVLEKNKESIEGFDITDTLNESSETLATFYTTYTYYTTIFAEGETDIMSHTEVVTNIKKNIKATATNNIDTTQSITSTTIPSQTANVENLNASTNTPNPITEMIMETNSSGNDMMLLKPNIPDLEDLSVITLVTNVQSSSSSGNQHILNEFKNQMNSNETNQKQQQQQQLQVSVLDDQISSETNTDTDEIIPSATLLLQTSFTTFTYYTTMYSGDKTNIISRLETSTNTVTETLQPSKTFDSDTSTATVPVTYFTTFTYWTKLARDGEITTLSREETISNVITPTVIQPSETQTDNMLSITRITQELEQSASMSSEIKENTEARNEEIIQMSQELQYITKVQEPTTYYTTYTYYTTSYESDKTITDSRFETVTDIITPTVTLTNNIETISPSTVISTAPIKQDNTTDLETDTDTLILYDFKKIIDADGISTIFFTTEIKPTKNSEGHITELISSTSSLFIDEEKQKLLATETPSLSAHVTDGQTQKQYKTGLVRLIEGTRIANRTTTLYQSKVIGTVIDQRYAQIIESTSSFIFEKLKTELSDESLNIKTEITPTQSIEGIQNEDQTVTVAAHSSTSAAGSLSTISTAHGKDNDNTKTGQEVKSEEEEIQAKNNDEKLRYPFQTKKSPFITPPLRTFSNRNRPQFAPKKNSSATIITRSDFTPTITATPALKTINRFSTSRKGSINAQAFATSSRRFGRPSKSSIQGLQSSSTISASSSRNRIASSPPSSNIRGSFSSNSRRLTGSSLSRPSLYSSAFPSGNSRLRIRPTASVNLGESSSSTLVEANSQEDKENSSAIDEIVNDETSNSDNEEEFTTESNRRQNNPLLRLRRPLNRPQGFVPARPQSNSPANAISLRRNPLIGRSRNASGAVVTTTTTTTTTVKPKPRTFQSPLLSQNRRTRPTNSLFPPRNIFLAQKPTIAPPEQNKDLSEETDDEDEDLNDNNDDSEYEDEDDEEEGEDETNSRRRRSNGKNEISRKKREADPAEQTRSNFRNRFRRPKLALTAQLEDDKVDSREAPQTTIATTTSGTQRTRSRFGARYSGHHLSSSTSATTQTSAPTTSSNHKAIRPTRPTNSNGVRAQFTLREKDSSPSTSTQKGLTSVKRPAFRRPQLGMGSSSRRLPSSTSSSLTNKRRLKTYSNSADTTTTARNSVTTRNRSLSPSSSPSRSRSSGSSRENNVRGRGRNNFNNNNNNDAYVIDNSGTITVTHVIPTDVTIPVVNGKVTEYKQVVTAKTSTEIIGPQQYSTTIGVDGVSQLVLIREDTSVNYNGATEVTQYILHETPTTTITFTPTSIRGRKTLFSHVLPSTVYSVEQVVSTVQPQLSANAPLANILLSQLLLGNVGLPAANPLLGALGGALTQPGIGLGTAISGPQQAATPLTEYKTHASTYVTTVFEGQSTVLPVTFQGKKILTTVYDTTAQTITATEFITDTIVTTPTVMAQPQPVVNSLLLQQLLLQQHLQQQQQQLQQPTPDPINPLNGLLNSVPPQFLLGGDNLQELEVSNTIRGSGHGQSDPLSEDDDFAVGSSADFDDIALQVQPQSHKSGRKKSRKNSKNHKRKQNNNLENNSLESSIITLYVSGRRPGEFSTVLSTVQVRPDSTQHKRQVHTIDSIKDYFNDGSQLISEYLAPPPEIIALDGKPTDENLIAYDTEFSVQLPTQSLESIVGDVSQWYATQTTTANNFRLSQSSTEIKKQKSSSIVMESKVFELNNSMTTNSQPFFV